MKISFLYCIIQIRITAVRDIAAGRNTNNYDNKLSGIRMRAVGMCFKIPSSISTRESEINGGNQL
jgi:hypothetical protein